MKLLLSWRSAVSSCLLLTASPLFAGDREVVSGYAQLEASSNRILFSLSALQGSALSLPGPPDDHLFIPPGRVRWEVEFTGTTTAAGIRQATALRTLPDEVAWPSGEELSPERYAGSFDSMNPGMNPLDPLGVTPGSGIVDYDGDGIPDENDAFPGDPTETEDTDGDGIGDNSDPDADGDGIPNSYELANGLNPLVNDAALDLDRDGYSNYAEYEAGTAANNARSFLRFTGLSLVPPATVRLTWDAVPGRTYSILHSPTLGPRPAVLQSGIAVPSAQSISADIPYTSSRDFYYLQVILDAP